MGFDLERFTVDIDQELKCPICCGVLEDPVQGNGCEHAYCKRCILEWMKNSESCPVDRNAMKASQLEPIPRIVRNLLNHLQVRCDYNSSGCQEVVRLEDLAKHSSSCRFNPEFPVACPKDCGAFIPTSQLATHDCVRDLRGLLFAQQQEINDLKTTINNLFSVAAEQREIARNNNNSLSALSERYDHLKVSIQNLEKPIRRILVMTSGGGGSGSNRSRNRSASSDFDDDSSEEGVKDQLAVETTTEIYISNLEQSVTPGTLQEYLMRSEINVVSCKEALCRGWKNDFKVTVFKSDKPKILQPNLWPKGIVCFVCGEYYSTKIEGCRDPVVTSDSGDQINLRACVPPWMMS